MFQLLGDFIGITNMDKKLVIPWLIKLLFPVISSLLTPYDIIEPVSYELTEDEVSAYKKLERSTRVMVEGLSPIWQLYKNLQDEIFLLIVECMGDSNDTAMSAFCAWRLRLEAGRLAAAWPASVMRLLYYEFYKRTNKGRYRLITYDCMLDLLRTMGVTFDEIAMRQQYIEFVRRKDDLVDFDSFLCMIYCSEMEMNRGAMSPEEVRKVREGVYRKFRKSRDSSVSEAFIMTGKDLPKMQTSGCFSDGDVWYGISHTQTIKYMVPKFKETVNFPAKNQRGQPWTEEELQINKFYTDIVFKRDFLGFNADNIDLPVVESRIRLIGDGIMLASSDSVSDLLEYGLM